MTLGSLFSSSGSFELAGALNGIIPVWASEVEPYPIAVTTSRFPNMQHLGSVTDVHGDQIIPVDVLTFGSPCQDQSVAGKQAGLHEGKRSSLFFEAIRIIREMRCATNGQYPRFAVFENVPGLFSSAKGADFRAVLQPFVGVASPSYGFEPQQSQSDSESQRDSDLNLCDDTLLVPEPPKGRWLHAGEIVGDHFSLAWRV